MGLKTITRRVKRIFNRSETSNKTVKISGKTSQAIKIIRPEDVGEQDRRPPPTRRMLRPRKIQAEATRFGCLTITELPWGIVHIRFNAPHEQPDTVVARDPITRSLSRRKLIGGMKRSTGYYDGAGKLYEETRADW
jgi:hypothetical protein